MRLARALVALGAAAALAATAACGSPSATSSGTALPSAPSGGTALPSTATSATSPGNSNSSASLPPWSSNAPGKYAGKISMPKGARIIHVIAGSSNSSSSPTSYKLDDLGNGMQVRYTCTDAKVGETDTFFNAKVGHDGSNYANAPGAKQSDSFFYNWDWLGIGKGTGGFIYVWGACSWEIFVLSFPQQPLPTDL